VGKYIWETQITLEDSWNVPGILLLLINGSLVKCGGECFSYTSEHALLKSQAKGYSMKLPSPVDGTTFGFTPSITSIRFPSAKHGPAIYKETRLKPQ